MMKEPSNFRQYVVLLFAPIMIASGTYAACLTLVGTTADEKLMVAMGMFIAFMCIQFTMTSVLLFKAHPHLVAELRREPSPPGRPYPDWWMVSAHVVNLILYAMIAAATVLLSRWLAGIGGWKALPIILLFLALCGWLLWILIEGLKARVNAAQVVILLFTQTLLFLACYRLPGSVVPLIMTIACGIPLLLLIVIRPWSAPTG